MSSMVDASMPMDSIDSSIDLDSEYPLWRFTTKIVQELEEVEEEETVVGGNVVWKFNFCGEVKKSSYTRVRAHLLKLRGKSGIGACKNVNAEKLKELQKIEQESKARSAQSKPKAIALPVSTSSNFTLTGYENESVSKKRASNASCSAIEKAFNVQLRSQLDAHIARMFYSCGLPFNLARSRYYLNSYTFAAKHNLVGYTPPGYNALRTTLLQKEKTFVEEQLKPIKSTWGEKGVSIASDGWSDSQRRSLINFMAIFKSGPMFLKAIDCSGDTKVKQYIFHLLKQVIQEVGVDNVVQVITDNAANCKGAGLLIEELYPKIFWTPCVFHTLNLALQNICNPKDTAGNEVAYESLCWITTYADDALIIKNFIMNHSKRLHIFNTFVPLKLLSVATTRFASMIVMLRRFKLIHKPLLAAVTSDEWKVYRDDDYQRAQVVREKILDDTWWDQIEYILHFTAPIYEMIRLTDTDKPCLHLVYDMWDTMIENVKREIHEQGKIKVIVEASKLYDAVHTILISRWNKANTPLHFLAHSLNPRYYSMDWLAQDKKRQPQHMDEEVCDKRRKCFHKYFPDYDERLRVVMEFARFSSMAGAFLDNDSIAYRAHMDPKDWWVIHGSSTPLLQRIALKLLAQPASSSCAERNWSTYAFIHSARRNKLKPKLAEDLVFVHSNLRILSRARPEYFTGSTKMWDIGGDDEDLLLATLSLDEPELEAIIFNDDED